MSDEDIAAVVEVLQSDFITQGSVVPRFEDALAHYCEAQHGVATSSGTAALHLACRALGLSEGDTVWTSPISFVASANCARYCGASVDFVDVSADYPLLDPNALEDKLKKTPAERLPKILIPVHFAGMPCDMESIAILAQQYDIAVIEDAAHALGALYDGQACGNCAYSDATIFSFHPVKSITTGEGGMVMSNEATLAQRMRLLRSHGISKEPAEMTQEVEGEWHYEQLELGYHYRMTDIQAALGLSQLQKLDRFIEARRTLAERYDTLLSELPLQTLPATLAKRQSAHHLYPIAVAHRAQVFAQLKKAGIGVNVHYIPIYQQPYYRALGIDASDYPQAEKYYRDTISIPLYPDLTHTQQDKVVEALSGALAK